MRKPVNPEDFNGNFVCEAADSMRACSGINRKGKFTPLRMVTLRCKNCGKLFDIPLNNAKRTKQNCCSKLCSHRLSETFIGGNERHPMYTRWLAMKQRCNNPKCKGYKNYGLRGIKIEEYLLDFIQYAEYTTSLSGYNKEKLHEISLDRENNNDDYRRGNLRWTNASIQLTNQRKQSNRSGYTGISRNTHNTSWTSRVNFKGKIYLNRTYIKLQDALEARNDCIRSNNLPHVIQEFKQV